MNNIIEHPLPNTEYYKEEHPKTQIYLHHTISSTASSAWNWWMKDKIHVATAFIIDKSGDIYKLFNPKYWSYHLGLNYGPKRGFADKKSIGIEIVNEGWLTHKDNKFYWLNGQTEYDENVIYEKEWRNQKYWATYTEEQMESTVFLVKHLCKEYDIPKQVLTNFKFSEDYAQYYTGILSHHNVRKDKTDVSPAFNMKTFVELLNNAD